MPITPSYLLRVSATEKEYYNDHFNDKDLDRVGTGLKQYREYAKSGLNRIINNNDIEGAIADFKIALDFERIYQIIFGSQLKLLERISILNYIDYSEIENFYKESGISMDQYSLRDWINYLKTSNLIETNDNKTVLTIKGNAFIEYINMHYKNLIKTKIL